MILTEYKPTITMTDNLGQIVQSIVSLTKQLVSDSLSLLVHINSRGPFDEPKVLFMLKNHQMTLNVDQYLVLYFIESVYIYKKHTINNKDP